MKSINNQKKGKIKRTGPREYNILYLPFLAVSKECEGNFIDFSHPLTLFKASRKQLLHQTAHNRRSKYKIASTYNFKKML